MVRRGRPVTAVSAKAALVAALSLLAAAVPAAAQQPIDVRVQVRATATYGAGSPDYLAPRLTGATQAVPDLAVAPGSSARCTQVFSGPGRTGAPISATPDTPLRAGVWWFVPDSCTGTITLSPSGSYRVILQGGPYVVEKRRSELIVAAVTTGADTDSPQVTLTAALGGQLGEALQPLPGREVFWDWEFANGTYTCSTPQCGGLQQGAVTQGCRQTTGPPEGSPPVSVATCTVTGDMAKLLLGGAGSYVAYWYGEGDHEPARGAGLVPEAQGDPATAGQQLMDLYDNPDVQIVAQQIPPGCGVTPAASATLGSLFVANCQTLQVMQILSGVFLGIAFSGAGGSGFVAIASLAKVSAFAAQGVTISVAAQVAKLAYVAAVAAVSASAGSQITRVTLGG